MAETMNEVRQMLYEIKSTMSSRGLNTTTYWDEEQWLVQGNTPHIAVAAQARDIIDRSLPCGSKVRVQMFFNQRVMEWTVVVRPPSTHLITTGVFEA